MQTPIFPGDLSLAPLRSLCTSLQRWRDMTNTWPLQQCYGSTHYHRGLENRTQWGTRGSVKWVYCFLFKFTAKVKSATKSTTKKFCCCAFLCGFWWICFKSIMCEVTLIVESYKFFINIHKRAPQHRTAISAGISSPSKVLRFLSNHLLLPNWIINLYQNAWQSNEIQRKRMVPDLQLIAFLSNSYLRLVCTNIWQYSFSCLFVCLFN